MAKRFSNKVILITGAASGIGRAAALRIASEGGSLIISDRNIDSGREVAREALERGAPAANTIAFDAADAQSCAEMVDQAVSIHGRLDCLINNAGVLKRGHFLEMTAADWSLVVSVNLTSLFHIIQRALPSLISSRGNVVSTASTAGIEGISYYTAYAASKAGVIALTKSLAAEYAPAGVRFNAICPGRVRTDLGAGVPPVRDANPDIVVRPSKLLGKTAGAEPEDIAGAFAYLASADACFTSGTILVVDGAQTAG
ncbi:SDR family NAD(P)-dependent oxidoreductase [Corticibacterium sp. UT-5YL-CI-8]|nr:SDR family NAD(P)-dependent oxidoreductase [Tianweitania sp. UT-5YL-CI-8]